MEILIRPLVTKCCGSFSWAEVTTEDGSKGGGTLCYACMVVVPNNVRYATDSEIGEK